MENIRVITQENIRSKNITDWHTHILPGIDDGSKDVEESLSMLDLCWAQGVKEVLLTPHFYPQKESPKRFLRRRSASASLLEKAISRFEKEESHARQIPKRILAAEMYYFDELASLEQEALESLCIEKTNMLMVEMPQNTWDERVFTCLETLLYERKITPLIAHIDRYYSSVCDMKRLEDLISEGLRIQLNAGALLGPFSRKKALRWIEDGFVHLIGSDCHNMNTRKPNLDKAFSVLQRKLGEAEAIKLFAL